MITVLIGVGCSWADEAEIGQAVRDMMSSAMEKTEAISVELLHESMAGEDVPLILDIRTEAEFGAGHIRGAIWIPRGKLEFLAARGEVPTDAAEIIVYCKRHGRSALAAETLQELGFENVKYLTGGFEAWAEAGYSIFNQHGELTVKAFEASESE
jgi:rhodanese-related sulfurtransferase